MRVKWIFWNVRGVIRNRWNHRGLYVIYPFLTIFFILIMTGNIVLTLFTKKKKKSCHVKEEFFQRCKKWESEVLCDYCIVYMFGVYLYYLFTHGWIQFIYTEFCKKYNSTHKVNQPGTTIPNHNCAFPPEDFVI